MENELFFIINGLRIDSKIKIFLELPNYENVICAATPSLWHSLCFLICLLGKGPEIVCFFQLIEQVRKMNCFFL